MAPEPNTSQDQPWLRLRRIRAENSDARFKNEHERQEAESHQSPVDRQVDLLFEYLMDNPKMIVLFLALFLLLGAYAKDNTAMGQVVEGVRTEAVAGVIEGLFDDGVRVPALSPQPLSQRDLDRLDKIADGYFKDLDSDDDGVRHKAVAELAKIGEPIVPILILELTNPKRAPLVREILRHMGEPALRALVSASSPKVLNNQDAIHALVAFGPEARDVVGDVLALGFTWQDAPAIHMLQLSAASGTPAFKRYYQIFSRRTIEEDLQLLLSLNPELVDDFVEVFPDLSPEEKQRLMREVLSLDPIPEDFLRLFEQQLSGAGDGSGQSSSQWFDRAIVRGFPHRGDSPERLDALVRLWNQAHLTPQAETRLGFLEARLRDLSPVAVQRLRFLMRLKHLDRTRIRNIFEFVLRDPYSASLRSALAAEVSSEGFLGGSAHVGWARGLYEKEVKDGQALQDVFEEEKREEATKILLEGGMQMIPRLVKVLKKEGAVEALAPAFLGFEDLGRNALWDKLRERYEDSTMRIPAAEILMAFGEGEHEELEKVLTEAWKSAYRSEARQGYLRLLARVLSEEQKKGTVQHFMQALEQRQKNLHLQKLSEVLLAFAPESDDVVMDVFSAVCSSDFSRFDRLKVHSLLQAHLKRFPEGTFGITLEDLELVNFSEKK